MLVLGLEAISFSCLIGTVKLVFQSSEQDTALASLILKMQGLQIDF